MAIARMLKVTVIGHGSVVDAVVERLQKAGVVEIACADADSPGAAPMPIDEARLHDADRVVAAAQFVRGFLGRFRHADVAFGMFISEKIHLSTQEFEALVADESFEALYSECDAISGRLGTVERERIRLRQLAHALLPWEELGLRIDQWQGSEHVVMVTGTVPASESAQIRQSLRDEVVEVTVAEVGRAVEREAWVVMAHRDSATEVRSVLAFFDFADVSFPGLEDMPATELAGVREQLSGLDVEQEGLEARVRELAREYPRAVALVEVLLADRDALEVRDSFAATERTFAVTGWAPEMLKDDLTEALAPIGADVDITFEKPAAGDMVPVELVNNRWVRPFEVLTDLYGRPTYAAFDPTPVVAPFFFLFFGMCLGDVGYGLMLMVGAWLIKTRLDVAPGVKKFMDLLLMGGFASIIWGAFTRSYLALATEKLPSFLVYRPLIDPQSELVLLLGVCVAIGVVHVSVGVLIAFLQTWHGGEKAQAIAEHGSSLAFIAAILGMVLAMVGWIPSDLAMPLLAAGALQLVLLRGGVLDVLAGRVPSWHLVLVPLKGFLGLYSMINFGSDFLSYTRLAALGLASLYVGDAMNRLADLSGGIPYVGWAMAVLIFVVGHTFNVVINLLGAFVHPTRLHYVEFFGKFYKGGGRNFAPFALRTKQLVLHPQGAGEQKGGLRL